MRGFSILIMVNVISDSTIKMKTIISLIAITPIIISFLNAEIRVVDAAKLWIRQYDNKENINQINVVHPSKILDIISR